MTVMSGLLGDPGTYAYSYNKFQSIRSLRGGMERHRLPVLTGAFRPTRFAWSMLLRNPFWGAIWPCRLLFHM